MKLCFNSRQAGREVCSASRDCSLRAQLRAVKLAWRWRSCPVTPWSRPKPTQTRSRRRRPTEATFEIGTTKNNEALKHRNSSIDVNLAYGLLDMILGQILILRFLAEELSELEVTSGLQNRVSRWKGEGGLETSQGISNVRRVQGHKGRRKTKQGHISKRRNEIRIPRTISLFTTCNPVKWWCY